MGPNEADLILVIGLVLGALAIPAVFSAWVDGRTPRGAALTVLVAGALVVFAASRKPGGYDLDTLPAVVLGVIARLF